MSRGLVAGLVVVVALAAAALAIAPPPDATATHRCREAGSTTIVKSETARIYKRRRNGLVYGCLYAVGKRVRLTETFGIPDGSLSETTLTGPKPRLAGRFVGFEYVWDNGRVGGPGLGVWDLRSGDSRGFDLDPSTEEDHPETSVSDIVVTTRGSMAWTWTAEYADGRRTREVRKLESDAELKKFGVILDSGPDIGLASLERRGSSVSWVKAGVRVSAPLR